MDSSLEGNEFVVPTYAEDAADTPPDSPTHASRTAHDEQIKASQREQFAALRRMDIHGHTVEEDEAKKPTTDKKRLIRLDQDMNVIPESKASDKQLLKGRRRSSVHFELPGTGEDEDEDDEDDDILIVLRLPDSDDVAKLTPDHAKLLYMMSRYARCSMSAREPESWIRQMPLLVLVYEGIVAGALDYDYAPCSALVSAHGASQRIWINITQEGKAAVDDLREWQLINGLKLSTEDFQPVTAFQVSKTGMELVKRIPRDCVEEVNEFIYSDPEDPSPATLKRVSYERGEDGEPGTFFLSTDTGERAESLITDSEDVSYVSSPFLPKGLRSTGAHGQEMTSNKSRAHESARGLSSIRDELSVAVELSNVRAMVCEWIPFGSNQIVALNERLGAMDRCQGGLFTAMVDASPTNTDFEIECGLTNVKILDFDMVRFINFEAEIMYPEEEGIVQIENFGMHLNVDGTIIYGLTVEAILDMTSECTCVDHLARVLVDVHQDSSRIMNDLLSPYQRSLLDMIFCGDMMARNKYNMLLSDTITPMLPAACYMDRSERETELKQVLGDLDAVYDLSSADRLLLGRDGALIVGPEAPNCEDLIVTYMSLHSKELMIRNFFNRTFVLDDELVRIRKLTLTYHTSPYAVEELRTRLQSSSRNLILMQEVLGYIQESLAEQTMPKIPKDKMVARQLGKRLAVRQLHHDVSLRTKDLFKLMDGAANKVKILQMQSTAIDKRTLEDTVKSIDVNFTNLVAASAAEQRSSASLEVMNIIFSGSFAFDIVDRISGDDILGAVGVDDQRGLGWINRLIKDGLVAHPLVFFLVNILWLTFVGLALQKLMRSLVEKGLGALSLRHVFNRRIHVGRFRQFLAEEVKLDSAGYVADVVASIAKCVWYDTDKERWGGATVKIDVLYDETAGFILSVLFNWNVKDTSFSNEEIVEAFENLMDGAGVWPTAEEAAAMVRNAEASDGED